MSTRVTQTSRRFDLRSEAGPFDIIGDVHGCLYELKDLLGALGYQDDGVHPHNRKLVFLGDINDRGPYSALAFELVMLLAKAGHAYYTPGNHCNKLMRYLQGRRVQLAHGLEGTVRELDERKRVVPGLEARIRWFIESAPTYLWLARGELVVAHAGIKEGMIGTDDSRVRSMCLYGDVTGESNPDGTPVRLDWAQHYRGRPAIVYGHTPVAGPTWVNNTVNIDQGCVFGGWLTALRWPEREVVQVRAQRAYYTGRVPAFLA